MKILIVDDEPLARKRLHRMLEAIDGVSVAGEATNGREALDKIAELSPDVVLLDIHMPGLDGLAAARALTDPAPHVIFVTAYDQHAVEAFDVQALDYLLKPVEAERLEHALERVRKLQAPSAQLLAELLVKALASGDDVPRIIARQGDRVFPVDARKVSRFYSSNKYTAFHLDDRTLFLDDSLNQLEERLTEHGFLRVHRGELINLERIQSVRADDDGLVVELDDGQTAQVSRRMVKELKKRLGM